MKREPKTIQEGLDNLDVAWKEFLNVTGIEKFFDGIVVWLESKLK